MPIQSKLSPTTGLSIPSTSILGVGLWATVMQSPILAMPASPTDLDVSSDEAFTPFQMPTGEADGLTVGDALTEMQSQWNGPTFQRLIDGEEESGDRLMASTTLTVTLNHAPSDDSQEDPQHNSQHHSQTAEPASPPFTDPTQALEPAAPFSLVGVPDVTPAATPLTTVPPTAVPPGAELSPSTDASPQEVEDSQHPPQTAEPASPLFTDPTQALEPAAPFSLVGAPDVTPAATPLTTVPPGAELSLSTDDSPQEVAATTISIPALPSSEPPAPAPQLAIRRAPGAPSSYRPTDTFQFQPPVPQPVEILAAETAPTSTWGDAGSNPSIAAPADAAPGSYLSPPAANPLTASTPFVFSPPSSPGGVPAGAAPIGAIAPTPPAFPTAGASVVVIVIPPGSDLSTLPPWLTQSIQTAAPGASSASPSPASANFLGQSPPPPLQPVPPVPVPVQTPDPGPLTPPSVQFQGAAVLLDDDLSARARLTAVYPVTPDLLFGGSFDITEGSVFADSELEGANINELYLTYSLPSVPNLRFTLGQIDLTSYFDRNSFAKDALTHFINPVFQTNPALAANAIGSRVGGLLNYSITDNVEARAAVFSSDRSIGEFELDAFAGELGVRFGNAIVRGTYVSARDGGANDGPQEIFNFVRDDGIVGVDEGDREEAFGVNAEVFIPGLNMGLFGRYGRQENRDADFVADTFSAGFNLLDVFMQNDRLGLAYGRALSNSDERRDRGDEIPDVLEVFYDFPITSYLRAGFTLQQLNEFTETVAGFRIRTDLDVTP